MRSGFSTSACAAASAAAGIESLWSGRVVTEVVIDLPAKRGVRFAVARCERQETGVLCGVVKDAGDDPDVTNGLEIQALVEPAPEPGLTLLGGKGVGVVTLPGLPVAVGEPAINPGPRRLIRKVIQDTLETLTPDPLRRAQGRLSPKGGWGLLPLPSGEGWGEGGLRVTVIVPDGERIAQQTMNPKLGILGGISILGTDGIVRPYSASAFRASIHLEMNVAREAGYKTIGLATGKRSAAYLRAILENQLPSPPGRGAGGEGLGVVDVGDELGYPLQQAVKFGFRQVVFGGMIGKFSKLAQGRFQTHVQEGEVNFEFLAEVAAGLGAPPEVCARILTARTAHQVQGWLKENGIRLEPELARRAAQKAVEQAGGKIAVKVLIFSLDGELLGEADYA